MPKSELSVSRSFTVVFGKQIEPPTLYYLFNYHHSFEDLKLMMIRSRSRIQEGGGGEGAHTSRAVKIEVLMIFITYLINVTLTFKSF